MTMLFLLVSFQQALLIVHFKLNQKEIEKEFCVNKAKPQLQCHGKCHLKKDLEKSEKNDLELTNIAKKIEIVLISIIELNALISKTIKLNKVFIYKKNSLLEPHLEIIVPPPILIIKC